MGDCCGRNLPSVLCPYYSSRNLELSPAWNIRPTASNHFVHHRISELSLGRPLLGGNKGKIFGYCPVWRGSILLEWPAVSNFPHLQYQDSFHSSFSLIGAETPFEGWWDGVNLQVKYRGSFVSLKWNEYFHRFFSVTKDEQEISVEKQENSDGHILKEADVWDFWGVSVLESIPLAGLLMLYRFATKKVIPRSLKMPSPIQKRRKLFLSRTFRGTIVSQPVQSAIDLCGRPIPPLIEDSVARLKVHGVEFACLFSAFCASEIAFELAHKYSAGESISIEEYPSEVIAFVFRAFLESQEEPFMPEKAVWETAYGTFSPSAVKHPYSEHIQTTFSKTREQERKSFSSLSDRPRTQNAPFFCSPSSPLLRNTLQ